MVTDEKKKGITVPKLLDLCCCAGGASMGYYLAGFDVTGVDILSQPRYPFTFYQDDALRYVREHGHEYDAIVGSPPCQNHSLLNAYNHHNYPDLIADMRSALIKTGKPWIIENVPQAPLIAPVLLCGTMFKLPVYRHRVFESSFPIVVPEHPEHTSLCARNGYLPTSTRPFMSIHGGKHSRAWQHKACEHMECFWMIAGHSMENLRIGIREICESIPPTYTEYLGRQLLSKI